MKRLIIIGIFAVAMLLTLAGCQKKNNQKTQDKVMSEADISGKYYAKITISGYGEIEVELDADAAPVTVQNFMDLVNEGFYDGLTFHRIISGFMIQGGDPNGNGTGGSGKNIIGEFENNGIDNPLKHERGTLSMARSRDNNSASSQFFIMHEDSPHLDGDYAAFGHVISGMEVVDEICDIIEPVDSNGTVVPEDQPVIEKIEMIEK